MSREDSQICVIPMKDLKDRKKKPSQTKQPSALVRFFDNIDQNWNQEESNRNAAKRWLAKFKLAVQNYINGQERGNGSQCQDTLRHPVLAQQDFTLVKAKELLKTIEAHEKKANSFINCFSAQQMETKFRKWLSGLLLQIDDKEKFHALIKTYLDQINFVQQVDRSSNTLTY